MRTILWPTGGDGWVHMGPGMFLGGPPLRCVSEDILWTCCTCVGSLSCGEGIRRSCGEVKRTLVHRGNGAVVTRLRTDTWAMVDDWEGYGLSWSQGVWQMSSRSCWSRSRGGFVNGPLETCVTRRAFCSSAARLSRIRVPDGEMSWHEEWAVEE